MPQIERTSSELIAAMEDRGWLPGDLMPHKGQRTLPNWGRSVHSWCSAPDDEDHPVVWIALPIPEGDTSHIFAWISPRGILQGLEIWNCDAEALYRADRWPGLESILARAQSVLAEDLARGRAEQAGR
jgi:hypothetical protein